MLWIIGGWGNRPDSLESAVDRLQRSLSRISDESGKYGPWGYWQRRHPDDEDSRLDFVPIDAGALADAIVRETEQVRLGPNTAPGAYVDLSRPATVQRSPTSSAWFKCIVRVGFIDQPRPLNHIAFEVDDDTDEPILAGYLGALIEAWQPDRLGVLTVETKRAQGHKGPQVAVGRLTYIADSVPLDTSILDDGIEVAEAEGGYYIRVPGTIEKPDPGPHPPIATSAWVHDWLTAR